MNTGQHGFLNALVLQAVDFVNNFGRIAAALLPPRHGDNAIGAAVAAAILHLDEGAVTSEAEQGRFARFCGVCRHGRQRQPLPGDGNQPVLVGIGDDQIDAQGFGFLAVQRGIATAEHHFGAGIFPRRLAQQVAGFADGILGDGAGVEDQQVGLFMSAGQTVPLRLKLAGPGFQFGFVEAAAQGLEPDTHGG